MRLYMLLAVVLTLIPGCGSDREHDAGIAASTQQAAPQLWDSKGFSEARAIYQNFCAACHDAGASDAPAIGEQEDWDGRSRMWVSVLSEHAKKGYLAMPAKGGSGDLTDLQVGAAAEYMMAVTYPELPLD